VLYYNYYDYLFLFFFFYIKTEHNVALDYSQSDNLCVHESDHRSKPVTIMLRLRVNMCVIKIFYYTVRRRIQYNIYYYIILIINKRNKVSMDVGA